MVKQSRRNQIAEQGNPVVLTLTDALALAHGVDGPTGAEAALAALHTRIDTRWGCPEDLVELSVGERGLLLTRAMLDEVDNGGLYQYLWNSAGDDAEELRGFLRRAGMDEAAGILDRVSGLFPDGHVPRERQLRQKALEQIEDQQPTMLDEMSRRMVEISASFAGLLLRQVEEHRKEFAQPSDDLVRRGIRSRQIRELQGVQVALPDLEYAQTAAANLERLAVEVTEEKDRSSRANVEQLLATGRKADAIMEYRKNFSCSLLDAKQAVERMLRKPQES